MMPDAAFTESYDYDGVRESGGGGGDGGERLDYAERKRRLNYYSSKSSSPSLELYDNDSSMNDNDSYNADDGSDHANNDDVAFGEIYRHPQHHYHHHQNPCQQHDPHHHHHHHATPHGNMTSILSMAGSYSPQKKTHNLQNNNQQQKKKTTPPASKTFAAMEGGQQKTGDNPTIAAKRALRVRASKYFHRGGGGGGADGSGAAASTTTTVVADAGTGVGINLSTSLNNYGHDIDIPINNGSVDKYHGNGKNNDDKKCERIIDTTDKQEEIEFVDEKGIIRIMNHRTTSNSSSSSSNATTALLSASTASPSSLGAVATAAVPTTTAAAAAAAAAASQTTIHDSSPSQSSLSFFPRTTSAASSSLSARNLVQHYQHPHPSSEDENTADPSLQTYLSPSSSYDNLLEVRSNATSGYTSGGGSGSDLEVAARRILRGKKERGIAGGGAGGGTGVGGKNNGRVRHHPTSRSRSNGVMSESEDDDDGDFTDDDDNIGIINLGYSYNVVSETNGHSRNNNINNNNKGIGRALPPGWRERIQRKTGMQLVKLPLSQPPPLPPISSSSSSSLSIPSPTTPPILPSKNIVSTAAKTGLSSATKETATNAIDYSYCYPSDDDDDPCNQLGLYSSDGQLAMTKRAKNANDVSPAAPSSKNDHDNHEWNDEITNNYWQHLRHQYQHQEQYEEFELYPERHPPTPSPTESIETTYHLEDLVNNGAFPSRSHNRNHPYGQNVDYDDGYTTQSIHWQLRQEQEQRRLPIVHEHHDLNSNQYQTSDDGYDVDDSYNYDAEEEGEANDFDQNYYSHDNKEYNPDILTESITYDEHDPSQSFEPILKHDKIHVNGQPSGKNDNADNSFRNFNVSSNNQLVPIIINEYGFPPIPINPDVAHFGDNYYVKKEGLRLSNNYDLISQQTRRTSSPSSQKTNKRRVHFASPVLKGKLESVEVKGGTQGREDSDMHGRHIGDGGQIIDNDNLNSDGFDDDEYFHRFYHSNLVEEGPRRGQEETYNGSPRGGLPLSGDWEDIPATPKVQWASTPSSRSYRRTSSINEFNGTKAGDSDSALSVSESKTSSPKTTVGSPTTDWNGNDGTHPNNSSGIRQEVSSIPHQRLQKEISKEKFLVESNSVMNGITQSSSRPPRGKSSKKLRSQQQKVNAFYDQWVQESKEMQFSARKTAEYSLSDGDLSDKGYSTAQSTGGEGEIGTNEPKKRGMKFFRGRNRAYNSEGERSDTSVEGGGIKGSVSFNLSPLRSGRRENKKDKMKGGLGGKGKTSRRMRLFGHTHHLFPDNIIDKDGENLSARNEPYEGGVASQPLVVDASSNDARIGQSSDTSAVSMTTEHIKDSIIESEVDATHETATRGCSREVDSKTIISDCNEQEDDHPPMESNLNDSRETHTTPIASNAKAQTRVHSITPRAAAPTNKVMASGIPLSPGPITSTSKKLSPNHPQAKQTFINDRIGSQRKPGWTREPIITECIDDGTVSTLGSLVTKDTETRSVSGPRNKAHFSSDASTVTELSEIERLRRENDRLREKLENASHFSSKVSSMYAESLKLENDRLRQEYGNVSQLSTFAEHHSMRHNKHNKSIDLNHKTTLETLLEKGNDKQMKKSRRRAKRDSPVADFNHLPPVAHLINGVDFDDDSLTSNYSLSGIQSHIKYVHRGNGCETPEDLLKKTCTRIATTTRSVASQVKLALAQDPNDASSGTAPSSRPLNCFTTCRRDKTNDGTTVYVTEKQFNSARRANNTRYRQNAAPSHRTLAVPANSNQGI